MSNVYARTNPGYPDNGVNIGREMLRVPTAERNIFGRFGKLFIQEIDTNPENKSQSFGKFQWLANVTDVKASLVIDKEEVKCAGDKVVRYKSGAFTGEGTMTFDKVNSYFEKMFIDHVNNSIRGITSFNVPMFFITISLEDQGEFLDSSRFSPYPGTGNEFATGIEPGKSPNLDARGFAIDGHEQIILQNCQFWDLPLGYSTTDMVTQDMTFTFQGAQFGGNGEHYIDDFKFRFPKRIC